MATPTLEGRGRLQHRNVLLIVSRFCEIDMPACFNTVSRWAQIRSASASKSVGIVVSSSSWPLSPLMKSDLVPAETTRSEAWFETVPAGYVAMTEVIVIVGATIPRLVASDASSGSVRSAAERYRWTGPPRGSRLSAKPPNARGERRWRAAQNARPVIRSPTARPCETSTRAARPVVPGSGSGESVTYRR
jgi:hypothetical protein